MTFYEHAMVGVCGVLATGLQRRHGWQIVAVGGAAAVLPDWDGLTILLGSYCFSEGHRLWGHNLLVGGLTAAGMAWVFYRFDVLGRLWRWLAIRWKAISGPPEPQNRRVGELLLWIGVAVAASYSHFLMDIVCSAGNGLPTWGVPLFWPFAETMWAYPLLPWGNVGATLIFAASMFAMAHWRSRVQLIASVALLAVAGYMAVCGMLAPPVS